MHVAALLLASFPFSSSGLVFNQTLTVSILPLLSRKLSSSPPRLCVSVYRESPLLFPLPCTARVVTDLSRCEKLRRKKNKSDRAGEKEIFRKISFRVLTFRKRVSER